MLSWIRHYVAEVCTLPSAPLVYIINTGTVKCKLAQLVGLSMQHRHDTPPRKSRTITVEPVIFHDHGEKIEFTESVNCNGKLNLTWL